MKHLILSLLALFTLGDCLAYHYAKYPERVGSPWYKLPGGGFVAWLKLGRNV